MRLLDEKGRLFGRVSIVDLGLALLILLVMGPAIYFAWEIRSAAPYISRVEPMETIISPNKNVPLVVWGKWLDSQSVVRLDRIPLITVAANTQRLDLLIPTQKIHPGAYSLTVTNRRGLLTTWKEQVRLLSTPPKITEVRQIPSKGEREIKIIILGKNFDKEPAVSMENWPMEITYKSPTRLEARAVLPPAAKAGSYPIQVTSSYGQSDQRDRAVTVSPAPAPVSPPAAPASPPAKPAVPPPAPPKRPPAKLAVVQVLCLFEEPEIKSKRKLLKEGAISTMGSNDNHPAAKIIKIHNRIPIPKSDRRSIIASVVLACTQDVSFPQKVFFYGAGLRECPPEGETVEIGKHLPFQFQSLDIEGTVLADPVSLGDKDA